MEAEALLYSYKYTIKLYLIVQKNVLTEVMTA